MDYRYIPLPERRPLVWPGGARLALVVTLNLESWDLARDTDADYHAGGPAIAADILPARIPDFPNYTWREYGQRVGVWRLYDLFDEIGVKASCTANAVTFDRHRAMVQAALDRGWEIVAHDWEQGDRLSDHAGFPAREHDVILKTLAKFEAETGRRAQGWLSASQRGTLKTADILVEQGCIFYCDLMNDDQPYLLETPLGPIVSIPYSNELDDNALLARRHHTTDEFRDLLIEEFDVLYAEGEHNGRMMTIGLHPHVAGRAHRVRAIREFLLHAKAREHVWWPSREEIARWYLANHQHHIP